MSDSAMAENFVFIVQYQRGNNYMYWICKDTEYLNSCECNSNALRSYRCLVGKYFVIIRIFAFVNHLFLTYENSI